MDNEYKECDIMPDISAGMDSYSLKSSLRQLVNIKDKLFDISPTIRADEDYIELMKNINEAINKAEELRARYGV
jgi:hypothetical protein